MTAGNPYLTANPYLLRLGLMEGILDHAGDDPHVDDHAVHSVSEGVVSVRWSSDFIQRYIDHKVGIHLYFHSGLETGNPKRCDGAITIERSVTPHPQVNDSTSVRRIKEGANLRSQRSEHMQLMVPISLSPIVKKPKDVVGIPDFLIREYFGSSIRLYGFNNGAAFLRQDFPIVLSALFERPTRSAKRKAHVIAIGGRVLPGLLDGCTVSARIKSGSELIEHLAKQNSELGREGVVSTLDEKLSAPVVLYISKNIIRLTFSEFAPELGQCVMMCFCPRDTLPTAIECPVWTHEGVLNVGVNRLRQKKNL